VIETGRPINEIAKELEIHEGTLGHWVKQWKDENPEPETALTPMERVRVAQMADAIGRLRIENEFLEKAAVIHKRV
jgi:transposase-like protein